MLTRALTLRLAGLVALETALIVGAFVLAAYLRRGDRAWEIVVFETGSLRIFVVAALAQSCLYYADLYNLRVVADRRELFIRIVQALAAASFILAALYYWIPALTMESGVFMLGAGLVVLLVIGWRIAFEWGSRHVRPRERLLIVGTNPAAIALASEIEALRHQLGVEIVGFIDPDPAGSPSGRTVNIVGTIDDIPSIVRARHVDRVVVSLSDARGKLPIDKLLEMKLDGVAFDHLASVYEEYMGKIAVENLRPSWLIFSAGFRKTRLLAGSKRLLDVTVALVGMVLALPVMVLLAIAVLATSAGPLFYHQRRVGHHGRIFTVHKIRSMRQDAESATGAVWAAASDDPRVTPIGSWLRRARLDEVPQLWNVLRGDMSFVGPRPERPEFVADLTRQIPFYRQRHLVRPGLTGWAQIRYTYGATAEDALQKLQYDLYYIKHLSIAMDLFIILSTVKTVVLRKGA